MKKLDRFVAKRHEIAKRYDVAFAGTGVTAPYQAAGQYSAYHLYAVQVEDRDALLRRSRKRAWA